ncbi:hypothetical protein LTR66_000447 [Elasticomyces elasticus]|nr:hypothetical protein LTR66_000447 [Elasticomyces elasticus]
MPTPRNVFGGGSNGGSQKPRIEILPDLRFIVFHGNEHEASSVKLTGQVVLHAPEPISIKELKIFLEGKRKVSWWYTGSLGTGQAQEKKTFWSEGTALTHPGTHKVNAGRHTWAFEFDLSPGMPESVEGMAETYIAYSLNATLARPSWNTKDLVASEHIRIVRTIGQEQHETQRSRVNADIWANKLMYNISIDTDAIIFGTSIKADMEFTPLRKGIKLGKLELRLIEIVVKKIQESELPGSRDRQKTEEIEVAKLDSDFPEHSRVLVEDDNPDNPPLEDEKFKFSMTFPLPRSLNECRQDVDSHQINISHRFKLMLNIHNPEGHVSQLVCRLPVRLFISPNMPVDEQNNVTPATRLTDLELNQQELTPAAPPEYGRHQLDQFYNDIDPAGFMTPGVRTGTSTPFCAQSRNTSSENLQSIDFLTLQPPSNDHAPPNLLHSRLARLQDVDPVNAPNIAARPNGPNHSASGGNTPHSGQQPSRPSPPQNAGPYFVPPERSSAPHSPANSGTPYASEPHSRHPSTDHLDIHQSDYDYDSLSRTPSYGAALRTPAPQTAFTEVPPSYETATSRPPSPIQRPGMVHLRNTPPTASGFSSPSSLGSQDTMTASTHALRSLRMGHRASTAGEEEARVRQFRAGR